MELVVCADENPEQNIKDTFYIKYDNEYQTVEVSRQGFPEEELNSTIKELKQLVKEIAPNYDSRKH